ncbi:hypothetical protein BD779DRAFT_1544475 [Infundibulicybe gibba]|nr:hypothetical protein BD779DRAFT_1544475 [Infundibulicybe gibba]
MASTGSGHLRTESAFSTADSLASDAATLASPTPSSSAFKSLSPQMNGASTPVPTVIPPEHPFRTLVLCFDGTGDQYNSNIVELFTLLKKDDRDKQMVYYQAGIGTYTTPQIATPFMAKFPTRSLAGMIHKVGLLPACNIQQVPFAYKMYTRADDLGWQQSNASKRPFQSMDTVNSVGLIPRRLPVLDERRAKFKANLWNRPNEQEQVLSITDDPTKKPSKKPQPRKSNSLRALEIKYGKDHSAPTDVDEVWFAGCHCDVGGGSVSNDTTNNLARIPLRWMLRECFKTKSGIMFDVEGLRKLGLNPDALYPDVLPRPPALSIGSSRIQSIPSKPAVQQAKAADAPPPTEEELDLQDALSPIYDQLSLAWFWWLLELFPMKHRYQKTDDSWASYFAWNLGRGRVIPKHKPDKVRVHRSVKTRLDAQDKNGKSYKPKATLDLDRVTWVD